MPPYVGRRADRGRWPGRAVRWPHASPGPGVRTRRLRGARDASATRSTAPASWRPRASTSSICRATPTLNHADRGALRLARRHHGRLHDARRRSRPSSIAPTFDRALAPSGRRRRRGDPRPAPASRALDADASGVRAHGWRRGRSRRASSFSPAAPATRSSAASVSACRASYLHTAQRELPAGRLSRRGAALRPHVAPGGLRVGRARGSSRRSARSRRRHGVARRRRLLPTDARPDWRPMGSRRGRSAAAAEDPAARRDRPHATPIALLAIGDAAGLVKPTTGGGIHYSILSAALAADVAIDALRARSPRRRGAVRLRARVARPARRRVRRPARAARRASRG